MPQIPGHTFCLSRARHEWQQPLSIRSGIQIQQLAAIQPGLLVRKILGLREEDQRKASRGHQRCRQQPESTHTAIFPSRRHHVGDIGANLVFPALC
jgi:hypothetical protein